MFRPCRERSPAQPQKPQHASLQPTFRQHLANQRRPVSLTDTYTAATTCKRKLGMEADRADHQLHRLVCHANTLDMLIEELHDREQGLEGKLNAVIRAMPQSPAKRQIQWLDRIAEELEEDESDSADYSDFDASDNESHGKESGYCRASPNEKSPVPKILTNYFACVDEEQDEDEDARDPDLILKRWPSAMLVPELTDDEGAETEDEGPKGCLRETFTAQCSITVKPKTEVGKSVRVGGAHRGIP